MKCAELHNKAAPISRPALMFGLADTFLAILLGAEMAVWPACQRGSAPRATQMPCAAVTTSAASVFLPAVHGDVAIAPAVAATSPAAIPLPVLAAGAVVTPAAVTTSAASVFKPSLMPGPAAVTTSHAVVPLPVVTAATGGTAPTAYTARGVPTGPTRWCGGTSSRDVGMTGMPPAACPAGCAEGTAAVLPREAPAGGNGLSLGPRWV